MQGLPGPFCKIHLPGNDIEVIIEDENGEEFPIKYIANKTGLSAGWRKFVAGNKLVEGDVLIFQLIGPCRFKVMQSGTVSLQFSFYILISLLCM